MSRIRYRYGSPPVVIVVDGTTEKDIFDCYEANPDFPEYFSRNFDSLAACLQDLLDDDGRTVIVVHRSLLDAAHPRIGLYVDILDDLAGRRGLLQIWPE